MMNSQKDLKHVISAIFLSFFLGASEFIVIAYYFLLYKKFKLKETTIYNFIITVTSLFVLINYFNKFTPGKILETTSETRINFYEIKFSIIILLFIFWLHAITYLKMTKSFGLLVKIMILMLRDLAHFIIIILILIMAFATLYHYLFQNFFDNYSSFEKTIETLIFNNLGDIGQPDDIYHERYSDLLKILQIIFLFIASILLLNLLIAILSNTYASF